MADFHFIVKGDRAWLPDGKTTYSAARAHVLSCIEADKRDGMSRADGMRIASVPLKRIRWLDAGTLIGRCKQ